ncbi:MAG: dipeptidase [Tumebacillaceae bacterium]
MNEKIEAYLQDKREAHLEQLKQFVRIPSISTMAEHKADVLQCAEFVAAYLREVGFEHVELLETAGGAPVVYGDWLHAPGKPTVLVYGHYDVMPAGPVELWESSPFEGTIRDGKFYARGASDNKGQIFSQIKSFEAYLAITGELPVNVKFCIEGEEEIGSGHLPALLEAHQARFAADVVVLSDTAMLGENLPAVCYGLRGLASFQLDVRGAHVDLPSGGMYGGAVQNPLHALVQLLGTMRDANGKITIEGFYDDVLPIGAQEQQALQALPHRDEEMAQRLNVPELFGEQGYSTLERAWARPTLEINGMYGGYQGEGIMTVIPSTAHAKVSCRLVPNQTPEEILAHVERHVRRHTPPGVTVDVTFVETANPYVTPIDHPAIQLAAKAYESAFGVPCHFIRAGGSIPVVETFAQLFGIPVVMMGMALPTANAHAANEHYSLNNFDKGIRTLCAYWSELDQAVKSR